MTSKLFSFEDLADKKTAAAVTRIFTRAGQTVAQADINPSTRRTAGYAYREMTLTFGDGQTVTARVNKTGDIFQILLNGKVTPIKNQGDHPAAIAEISKMLDAGRNKFQQALAKAAAKLPPSIRTAAPKEEELLTQKRDDLKVAVEAAKEELAAIVESAAQKKSPDSALDWSPSEKRMRSEAGYYAYPGGKSKGMLTYIKPDDFLALAIPGHDVEKRADEIGQFDLEKINNESLPYLDFKDGKVSGHEGRARALAAKRAGITRFPVILNRKAGPGKENDFPTELVPEGGGTPIKIPPGRLLTRGD
jgi:hypothetical protein